MHSHYEIMTILTCFYFNGEQTVFRKEITPRKEIMNMWPQTSIAYKLILQLRDYITLTVIYFIQQNFM